MNILSKTVKEIMVVDHNDRQYYVVKSTTGNNTVYSVYDLTGGFPDILDDVDAEEIVAQFSQNGETKKRRRRRTKAEIEAEKQ